MTRATRRIFLDTEFTDLPWTGRSRLLWVGLAADDGSSWSALNAEVAADDAVSALVRSNVLPHVGPDEPRLTPDALRNAILDFCGCPDEFWAWCPTPEDLVSLDAPAPADTHARLWDWDFQLLRSVVDPWPHKWPVSLCDLHALATRTGITLPENPPAHHPRYDALWNLRVFQVAARADR
jgi:hypothetical protein